MVTREIRETALELLRDPIYTRALVKAWQARLLGDRLEMMMYHYAFGKPTASLEISAGIGLAELLAGKFKPEE